MLPRRPAADAAFLARRLARIRWIDDEPGPCSRRRLAEICRAELEWAAAEWRRRAGAGDEPADCGGPHPSEASRLPHERVAASLVNAHIHVDLENHCLRELKTRLGAQRRAALDATQGAAYRAGWAARAEASLEEWRRRHVRRRTAWRAFLAAAARYRALRAAVDGAEALAA